MWFDVLIALAALKIRVNVFTNVTAPAKHEMLFSRNGIKILFVQDSLAQLSD